MKTTLSFTLFGILLSVVPLTVTLTMTATAAEPARASAPLSVAVFDFEAKEEAVRDLGPKLAALINARLSVESDLILVERAELEKALGEQELGLSGTVSGETAAKVGHLTGAKVLVTGKVFKVDRELMIVAKVIGTETSRVYGDLTKGPASGALDELATEVAKKVAACVATKGNTLVAPVVRREDRIEALKKELGEVRRPTVAVRIPEQHYGAPASDPAAQTELALILQQCGFTLIDETSGERPEIEILGEAFSAHGLRRGNLISCKARIEVKAVRKKDGHVLAVDRETSVAVDIAEQTAAKTGLQSGAATLASRLIPRLVPGNKVAANP